MCSIDPPFYVLLLACLLACLLAACLLPRRRNLGCGCGQSTNSWAAMLVQCHRDAADGADAEAAAGAQAVSAITRALP